MTANQEQISKGFYRYAQVSDFITVKNYIYLRQNGKKCLMLRFFNDSDFDVDSMTFTLMQLDSTGKVLSQSNVTYENIKFKSGELFVPDSAIVVDEFCSDFKIVIANAHSGKYTYTVNNGRVIVNYSIPDRELVGKKTKKQKRCKLLVKRAYGTRSNIAALAAAIAVIAAILLSSGYMVIKFINTVFPSKYFAENSQQMLFEERLAAEEWSLDE